MATNVRTGGLAVSFEVDSGVESGDIVRVGQVCGIAEIDATEGPDGNLYSTIALEGIASVETSETADQGDLVTTDTSAGGSNVGVVANVTVNGSDEKVVGVVTRDKGDSDGRLFFKLLPGAGEG